MVTTSGRARPALEVQSMFEPSRLELECLQEAYAHLVPILGRRFHLTPPQARLSPPPVPQAERQGR